VYEDELEVPRYSEQGTWQIEFVYLSDQVGNSDYLAATDLAAAGFPTTFEVTTQPSISVAVSDVLVAEGDFGTSPAAFTVSLSAPAAETVTVDYATADGTATGGSDYTTTSGTVTFDPGETSKTVSVPVIGDVLFGADEMFMLNLSNPVNATVGDGQGVGKIGNDDTPPTVGLPQDVIVTEGDMAPISVGVPVVLSTVAEAPVTVEFATADGTATAGVDYGAGVGTATIPAGATSAFISVEILPDLVDERSETFAVAISNPTNAVLGDASAVGTIVDNDPKPTLTIADIQFLEGDSGTTQATFTVTLSTPSGRTVKVNYTTVKGTAVPPRDFIAVKGTLMFAAGETSKVITVLVNGDTRRERNETFTVKLTSPVNATIADAVGVGTIVNDD
jgi:chitinase